MNAIIVDDEISCIEYLEVMCMSIPGISILTTFTNAFDALSYLSEHKQIQIVFLDIEMPGLTGMEAIVQMRRIIPGLMVVFVTGYEEYALEAFRVDALSYLLKPCHPEEIQKAIEKAQRYTIPIYRVSVQTFGNFSITIDNEPYRFSNKKAKELLAFLIDRKGAEVTMEQAIDILWENRPCDENVKQLYRKAVICLNQLCREKNLDFFVSGRGSCHIIPSHLDCDYYKLLDNKTEAMKNYSGKYMEEYSWAEETNGELYYKMNHQGFTE